MVNSIIFFIFLNTAVKPVDWSIMIYLEKKRNFLKIDTENAHPLAKYFLKGWYKSKKWSFHTQLPNKLLVIYMFPKSSKIELDPIDLDRYPRDYRSYPRLSKTQQNAYVACFLN